MKFKLIFLLMLLCSINIYGQQNPNADPYSQGIVPAKDLIQVNERTTISAQIGNNGSDPLVDASVTWYFQFPLNILVEQNTLTIVDDFTGDDLSHLFTAQWLVDQDDYATYLFLTVKAPGIEAQAMPILVTVSVVGQEESTQPLAITLQCVPDDFLAGNPVDGNDIVSSEIKVSGEMPLPVTLSSFIGKASGCTTILNWTAATELNFSFYEVERKTLNGFEKIGTVNAIGSGHTYQFVDNSPQNGMNIYRLKMVDIDTRFEYSHEAIVTSNCETALKLVPTITTGITYLIGANGDEVIKVISNAGQLIQTIRASNYKTEINLTGKAAGIYYVQVYSNKGQLKSTFKLMKE